VGSIALKRAKRSLRQLVVPEERLQIRLLKTRRIFKGKQIKRNKIIRSKEVLNSRMKTSNRCKASNSSALI